MSEAVSLAVDRNPRGKGLVVLALTGELVVTSRDALRESAEAEIADGARAIVVVVERLTHIDTSGLALLVHLAGRCAEKGGRLAVVGLKVESQEMRQHLFLDQAILFADDVEDAVAAISR
ncbi:MAG TPA: STAS domain-containing protein [Gemmatimonadota bacterium]|nr:STAS domain-containing protein [Gemmatimonadota bacterium]